MKIFILLIFILSFVSCSQKSGETSAKLKVSMGAIAGAPANFQGGLMLYGRSGDRAFGRVMSIDTIDEFVPNGNWHFYAVGWDGSDAMEGKVYCGHVANVNLDGNPREINLHVTNANCSNAIFSPNVNTGGGENSFPKIEIETCNKLSHVSDEAASCDYDPLNGTPLSDKGYAASYKMMLKSFDKIGLNYNVLGGVIESSRCGKVQDGTPDGGLNAGGNTQIQNLNMPVGSALTPFYTVVRAYFGSDDCEITSSTKGHKDIILKKGLNGTDFHYKAYTYDSGGGNFNAKLFARVDEVDVCKDSRMNRSNNSPKAYAAGVGTPSHPYVICTPYQLNAIRNTDVASSFKLGKHLNMNEEISALSAGVGDPCIDEGDNFYPIGGYSSAEAAAIGGGCSGTTMMVYTGAFDGNGKTIKNISLMNHDFDNVGFVRNLYGGEVFNVIFEGAEVEGRSKVGVVAGSADSAGDASTIKNIRIIKSDIRAGSDGNNYAYTGSVVGYVVGASGTFIANVKAKQTHVETRGWHNGGIVGFGAFLDLFQVAFDGQVYARENSGDDTGGIIGKLSGGSIEQAVFDGVVSSRSQYLGGIAGALMGNQTSLKHLASRGLVKSDYSLDSAAVNVGGLFGSIGNAPSVFKYGYFNGKIIHSCYGSTPANCEIGGIYGEKAAGSSLASYYSNIDMSAYNAAGDSDNDGVQLTNLYDDLIDTAEFGVIVNGTSAGYFSETGEENIWRTMVNGTNARMAFEDVHACELPGNIASISTQIASPYLRGTPASPIKLCSRSQFLNVATNKTKSYDVEDNIYIGAISGTDIADGYSGLFNGKEKVLFGSSISTTASGGVGIFRAIASAGVVKNLHIIGAEISESGGTNYNGALVGINAGTIDNVYVSVRSLANQKTGGVVGFNSGTIKNSIVDGKLDGVNNIGGVASKNSATGVIKKVQSYVRMGATATFKQFGGIVDENLGTIDQVMFNGEIDTGATSPDSNAYVGGVASYNNQGTITNSAVSERVKIRTKSNAFVGGIIGSNAGSASVSNSYNYGLVEVLGLTPGIAPGADVGGAVGSDSGTVAASTFYHAAGVALNGESTGGISSSGCSGGAMAFTLDSGLSDNLHNLSYANGDIIKITNDTNKEMYITVASAAVVNASSGVSVLVDDCFSGLGFDYATLSKISFYKESSNGIGSLVTVGEIGAITTYCAGATPPASPDFVCSSGWDIVNDDFGSNRVLAYFNAIIQGQNPPILTPIWEMGHDFPYAPELIDTH